MKGRSQSGPIVLIIALIAIPCALCLGAVGYWRYVIGPKLGLLARCNQGKNRVAMEV